LITDPEQIAKIKAGTIDEKITEQIKKTVDDITSIKTTTRSGHEHEPEHEPKHKPKHEPEHEPKHELEHDLIKTKTEANYEKLSTDTVTKLINQVDLPKITGEINLMDLSIDNDTADHSEIEKTQIIKDKLSSTTDDLKGLTFDANYHQQNIATINDTYGGVDYQSKFNYACYEKIKKYQHETTNFKKFKDFYSSQKPIEKILENIDQNLYPLLCAKIQKSGSFEDLFKNLCSLCYEKQLDETKCYNIIDKLNEYLEKQKREFNELVKSIKFNFEKKNQVDSSQTKSNGIKFMQNKDLEEIEKEEGILIKEQEKKVKEQISTQEEKLKEPIPIQEQQNLLDTEIPLVNDEIEIDYSGNNDLDHYNKLLDTFRKLTNTKINNCSSLDDNLKNVIYIVDNIIKYNENNNNYRIDFNILENEKSVFNIMHGGLHKNFLVSVYSQDIQQNLQLYISELKILIFIYEKCKNNDVIYQETQDENIKIRNNMINEYISQKRDFITFKKTLGKLKNLENKFNVNDRDKIKEILNEVDKSNSFTELFVNLCNEENKEIEKYYELVRQLYMYSKKEESQNNIVKELTRKFIPNDDTDFKKFSWFSKENIKKITRECISRIAKKNIDNGRFVDSIIDSIFEYFQKNNLYLPDTSPGEFLNGIKIIFENVDLELFKNIFKCVFDILGFDYLE